MERVVVWSGGINRRLNRHRAAWSEAAAGAVWRAGCVGTGDIIALSARGCLLLL